MELLFCFTTADKIILNDLTEKDASEEDIDKELDNGNEYMEKTASALYLIEDALDKLEVGKQLSIKQRSESRESLTSQMSHVSMDSDGGSAKSSGGSAGRSVNIKLPKLELSKFSKKVHEFQEFWDGFQSAIHENETLVNVDKFNYLRSFLQEAAKSVIAGMPMTDASYETAIE